MRHSIFKTCAHRVIPSIWARSSYYPRVQIGDFIIRCRPRADLCRCLVFRRGARLDPALTSLPDPSLIARRPGPRCARRPLGNSLLPWSATWCGQAAGCSSWRICIVSETRLNFPRSSALARSWLSANLRLYKDLESLLFLHQKNSMQLRRLIYL
jgi:hypothetical protein